MIEFSFTEMFLLCWAIFATGCAFYFYEREKGHNWFIKALIDNKEMRSDFFNKMDSHEEKA